MSDKKAGKFSFKELKSKLEENELDLSMNGLEVVPVKELAQLRKATVLDLSCNRLDSLSDDFCTLDHLVKLDLSQNQLTILPEQLGRLGNLEKLDLYKNQLEILPLSLARLKKLKWLDVKDNPLSPSLAKIAGDCLDGKQCQLAAKRMVTHMQQLESDQERHRQRQLQRQRELDQARQADELALKRDQKVKKKEKDPKKKDKRNKATENGNATEKIRFSERVGGNMANGNTKQKTRRSFVSRLCSILSFVVKLTIVFAGTVFALACVLAGLLYLNCTAKPNEWIPSSRVLCQELYHFSATGKPPQSIDALVLAATETQTIVKDRLGHVTQILVNADYAGMVEEVSGTVVNATLSTKAWIEKESPKWRKETHKTALWLWDEAKISIRWTLNRMVDVTTWTWTSLRSFIEQITAK